MAHFIGNNPEPSTPGGEGSERGGTTSCAIAQFLEFARGEAVRRPANGFRVGRMEAEERYCLGCFGVRWVDVVFDREDAERFSVCRCCGCERPL